MELFNWQVNMKNGDKFIVKSKHSDSIKFLEELLGHGRSGIVVGHYETVGRKSELQGANAVAIISTEVSSVEYCTKWKYQAEKSIK